MLTGRVHSVETLGALDGPGLRGVVFLQGCPLRCQYCHNPDARAVSGGTEWSSGALVDRLLRYRPYFGPRGGVTLSGGEPLLQAEFATEVLRACHAHGLHTAVDTSGCCLDGAVREALSHADLLILDIKHTDPRRYHELTGGELSQPLGLLRHAGERGIALWIRQVVVPGWNDTPDDMRRLAELLGGVSSVQRVELLPYHTMAQHKWQQLGLACPLAGVAAPLPETMAVLDRVLRSELADRQRARRALAPGGPRRSTRRRGCAGGVHPGAGAVHPGAH